MLTLTIGCSRPDTMKMVMMVMRMRTLGEVTDPVTAVPIVPTSTMVITRAYSADRAAPVDKQQTTLLIKDFLGD